MRLRLRFSALSILIMLTALCLLIFYGLLWTTHRVEYHEPIYRGEGSGADIPFMIALSHPNIYDLYAAPPAVVFKESSNATKKRIEELYYLVRDSHLKQTSRADIKKLYPVNPKWDLKVLIDRKNAILAFEPYSFEDQEETESNVTVTTTPVPPTRPPRTEKIFTEEERQQLRNYVIQKLYKWRRNHEDDRVVNIADLLHDQLVRDDSIRLNTSWYDFMKTSTNFRTYDPSSSILKRVLKRLQSGEIYYASEMDRGTQVKVILDLGDGYEALFKPYRVPRNYQTIPDHFYFSDIERHHAEIASFHLDKILGFYRIPPVAGRVVNITRDLLENADDDLADTFFTSTANNTCFRGHCSYYCDTSHAVCGKPGDRLEGSVQLLLPMSNEIKWGRMIHPYRRSYSATRKARWENDDEYCHYRVMTDDEYHTRLLLDMMDLSAFDFLTGNQDRHHMVRISAFGDNEALVHLDNGRSFGRYSFDDMSILEPIRQCCFFRYSTFKRLYRVYQEGLSTLMARSLEQGEILKMVLVDEHLKALDRRLEIIFELLDKCFQTYKVHRVVVDDGIE